MAQVNKTTGTGWAADETLAKCLEANRDKYLEPPLPDFDELRNRLSTDYTYETPQARMRWRWNV